MVLYLRSIKRLANYYREIDGAIRKGKLYMIPAEIARPFDKRKLCHKTKNGKFADILSAIDIKIEDIAQNKTRLRDTEGKASHSPV